MKRTLPSGQSTDRAETPTPAWPATRWTAAGLRRPQAKTLRLVAQAREILAQDQPMTLRQVYYQLVSRQALENRQAEYDRLGRALVWARQAGEIPWESIEDRLRRPRRVGMWRGLPDFSRTIAQAYRRDVWENQPGYVEVWCEKDALSGIVAETLARYGVTLRVGRGYDSWGALYETARELGTGAGVTVLAFGDFDPSGEDMVRSLAERLRFWNCRPELVKCALLASDIERYSLPPNPTKPSDTRRRRFVAAHGDRAVELDALPAGVLRQRIRSEVESRLDMAALQATQQRQESERERLAEVLAAL